jgi:hypothetical protein
MIDPFFKGDILGKKLAGQLSEHTSYEALIKNIVTVS